MSSADPHQLLVIAGGPAGIALGVLTHDRDDAYEQGRELIAAGALWR